MIDLTDTDYKFIVSIGAALLSASNLAFYIFTVFKGQTKPHSYTWLIWSLVTVVAAYAQYKGGAGVGIILTCWIAFACFTISMLGFFKGEKNIAGSDKVCMALCLFAIILWQVVDTPLWSLLLVTAIDVAGFYPTIRKSWNNPFNENRISFFIYGVTYSLGILALEQYNFLTVFYPVIIVLCSWGLFAFLMIRRYQLRDASKSI